MYSSYEQDKIRSTRSICAEVIKLMLMFNVLLIIPPQHTLLSDNMSLITKQEHAMLLIEQTTITERIAELSASTDLNKSAKTEKNKLADRLARVTKRLRETEATIRAAEDVAAAKIAAETAATEKAAAERRARLPADMSIHCEDCQSDFTFSGEEQERFTHHGWSFPFRCADCRQARKDARERGEPMENPHSVKLPPIVICCKDCKISFDFSAQDQKRFQRKGYENPIRCEDCRQKRKNAPAAPTGVLINCKECHNDFTHSTGAQKYYAEMKWKDPSNCADCRKLKKSKATTRTSKSSA